MWHKYAPCIHISVSYWTTHPIANILNYLNSNTYTFQTLLINISKLLNQLNKLNHRWLSSGHIMLRDVTACQIIFMSIINEIEIKNSTYPNTKHDDTVCWCYCVDYPLNRANYTRTTHYQYATAMFPLSLTNIATGGDRTNVDLRDIPRPETTIINNQQLSRRF